jgi:hypothetical protein
MGKAIVVFLVLSLAGGPSPATEGRSASGIWSDERTGLMWTAKGNGYEINWYDAESYCQSMSLNDFSDWELPTIDELYTLFVPPDTLPPVGHQIVSSIQLEQIRIWSNDTTSSRARSFLFFNGNSGFMNKDNKILGGALCVRPQGGDSRSIGSYDGDRACQG